MALTTGGSTDDAAAGIYGAPGDATRMSRMKNIAEEALAHTSGDGDSASVGDPIVDAPAAFKSIMDSGDNENGFGPNAPTMKSAGKIQGSPGFPGIP